LALGMSIVVYISLSILSIFTFGSHLKPDVIANVGEEVDHEWESIILRIAFAIVIVCHIPYVFFSSKESFLLLIDEWDRRSLSKSLDKTLVSFKAELGIDDIVNSIPQTPETRHRMQLEEQVMVYHQMNRIYYIGGTIFVYCLEIVLAIFILDVGVVF
jgi:hypothetical protein